MRFSRKQKVAFTWIGALFLLANLVALYFFGFIDFMNPEKSLNSPNESDRFDALVYIANQGMEGSRWQSLVIDTLDNDPSPDIREMSVITLRELGETTAAKQALKKSLKTEKEPSVQSAIRQLIQQWEP